MRGVSPELSGSIGLQGPDPGRLSADDSRVTCQPPPEPEEALAGTDVGKADVTVGRCSEAVATPASSSAGRP